MPIKHSGLEAAGYISTAVTSNSTVGPTGGDRHVSKIQGGREGYS